MEYVALVTSRSKSHVLLNSFLFPYTRYSAGLVCPITVNVILSTGTPTGMLSCTQIPLYEACWMYDCPMYEPMESNVPDVNQDAPSIDVSEKIL